LGVVFSVVWAVFAVVWGGVVGVVVGVVGVVVGAVEVVVVKVVIEVFGAVFVSVWVLLVFVSAVLGVSGVLGVLFVFRQAKKYTAMPTAIIKTTPHIIEIRFISNFPLFLLFFVRFTIISYF
jgi:hypothetical protein